MIEVTGRPHQWAKSAPTLRYGRLFLLPLMLLALAACGGDDSGTTTQTPTVNPDVNQGGGGGDPATPPSGKAFSTKETTARFLTQATFGPHKDDLDLLVETSPSEWIVNQFNLTPSYFTPVIEGYLDRDWGIDEDLVGWIETQSPTYAFWRHAVSAEDQLRQRVAFALSEIMVISTFSSDELESRPLAVGYYQDILVDGAFGNYRDLLEDVTYSPAMGHYLTYYGNFKGDAESGRMPDENYARELLQLFTIGLVDLNMDGTPVTDGNGNAIESYDNTDITGLAKVFTGLAGDCDWFGAHCDYDNEDVFNEPMIVWDEFHSELEKSFLGFTIPAGTGAEESIDMALDHIFNYQSLPPFISRQLIQRLVTSNPSGAYIGRVANAFAGGSFELPDGTVVGNGERGDMKATIAAILFDDEARTEPENLDDGFGKVREPIIRFTNWARAFEVGTVTPEYSLSLWDTTGSDKLSQHAFKSPSVFNFFRPGYVAPGTLTGEEGLTMPEMQIINATSITGYANFMTFFAFNQMADFDEGFETEDLGFTREQVSGSFIADYDDELELADDPTALVNHLDELLTYGTMTDSQKTQIINFIEELPLEIDGDPDYDGEETRVEFAVLLFLTSPDFLVQR